MFVCAIGTSVDGVMQAVKIYGLGLQPLQGGELFLNGTAILMHMTIAGVNSGNAGGGIVIVEEYGSV